MMVMMVQPQRDVNEDHDRNDGGQFSTVVFTVVTSGNR